MPTTGGSTVFDLVRTALQLLSWRFAALVLLTLVISLVSGASMIMLIPMLQVVGLEVEGGAGQRIVEVVFAAMEAVGLPATLSTVLGVNALVVFVAALLGRFQSVFSARLNQSVVRRLRQRLYHNLAQANWLYLAKESDNRFVHLLLAELQRLGSAISALVSLLVSVARALVYAVIAVVLSPALTGVTLVFGLLLSVLLLKRTEVARITGQQVSDAYRQLYSTTQDHLAAMKLIKSHALEDRQVAEYRRVSQGVEAAHVDVVRNQADVSFWLELGSVIGLSAIVFIALGLLGLPLTTVLLLLYLFSRLLPLLSGVQRNYQSVINLLPAYAAFNSALATTEDARETRFEESRHFRLRRSIELSGVIFRYGDSEAPGLDDVDLVIPAGATTALVGHSGAGKSTIADLVIGLISPDAGELRIDGEPLQAEHRRAWRSSVGYVSQDAFLFNETIRGNLLLSAPDSSEEELWEALRLASADFVAELPQGLETVVGDRGVRLSGGERQRLVLARALLRRPELLVLDEATSSLDAENEERIREAIDGLSGSMTILVIAHRLTSIRSADRIHVVDRGRIVESGVWDDLLNREGGRFRALAAAQGLDEESVYSTMG